MIANGVKAYLSSLLQLDNFDFLGWSGLDDFKIVIWSESDYFTFDLETGKYTKVINFRHGFHAFSADKLSCVDDFKLIEKEIHSQLRAEYERVKTSEFKLIDVLNDFSKIYDANEDAVLKAIKNYRAERGRI